MRGFPRGTINTSVFVANTLGFEQRPRACNCVGYFGEAAA